MRKIIITLAVCLALSMLLIRAVRVNAQVTTLASTELLNFYSMTTSEKDTFLALLDTQNITHFILRAMAMYEWDDTSWNTVDSRIVHAKEFIYLANAFGIDVSYDLHTWYTTWDNYFDDGASNHDANRAKYISYVQHVLSEFEGSNIHSFMVMNEPQAQTASSGENQFILDIITAANGVTDKPISVRFMGGYSPTTGHYAASIDAACDYICRNTYWDARYPTVTVYGTSEAKLLAAIEYAHDNSKEFWCTEFGKAAGTSPYENQRSYVEAWVEWARAHDADRIYCWVSQPEAGSAENYNIFTGYTPNPAFYELISETGDEPPAGDNVVTLNQPNNLQEFDYFNIYFNYTATFYQGSIVNSSLWANLSGTWQRLSWNTTAIVNATMHTINYTFSVETTYIWNIQVFNSTLAHWATANRTFTIETTPLPDDPPYYGSDSVSTTMASAEAIFQCEWDDDVSLVFGWLGHNSSGPWVNETVVPMFAPHLTFSDTITLPSSAGVIVGYRLYANDTASQENATAVYTLTTTGYEVSLTINSPVATTYPTLAITITMSASGGTIDRIWFNIKNGSSWLYSNTTYTTSTTRTLANGAYTFYGWANNTDGNSDSKTVGFSILIWETPPSQETSSLVSSQDVNLLDVPKNLANALGIPEYAGKLLMCALFTFWLLFPTAIYAKKNLEYIFILEGFLLLGFFIGVSWIEYWYMLVYVLVVAGLWAGKMKGIFY